MSVLQIPNAIYDYLLYYECANKDWSDKGAKSRVGSQPAGSLLNCINWGVTSTTVKGDSGGATKCGITHSTWKDFYNKNKTKYNLTCTENIDSLNKDGWLSLISEWWSKGPGYAANIACAIVLFQCQWGGWKTVNNCLTVIRNKADKKDYKFSNSGSVYKQIADATHAYNDPMDAYKIIRDEHANYLYGISSSGQSNSKFRVGWMRREVVTFQNDGLYVEPGISEFTTSNNSNKTISQWFELCNKLKGTNSKYVKIYDWEHPAKDEIVVPYDVANKSMDKVEYNGYQPKNIDINSADLSLYNGKNVKIKGIVLGTHMKQKK